MHCSLRRVPALLLATALVSPAGAQATGAKPKPAAHQPADELSQLLDKLGKVDPALWRKRITDLERLAQTEEQRAAKLRGAAARAVERAKRARAEVQRLQQLMGLIGTAKSAPNAPQVKPKPDAAKVSMATGTGAKQPPKMASATPSKQGAPGSPRKTMPRVGGPRADVITYEDHVQEIFMQHCSACHDSDSKRGGLDLTSFATARAGGSSGTTIVPGDPQRSRLFLLVSHREKPTMPPDEEPIDKALIEKIRMWIAAGAPENKADARASAKKPRAAPAAAALAPRFDRPAPMPSGWTPLELKRPAQPVGIKCMAASARSPLLALPGLNGVRVVHSATGKSVGVLPFNHGTAEVLAFRSDAAQLLVAGGTPGKVGRAELFDVKTGKLLGTYGKAFDSILAAAVHPRLPRIALGGSGRRVQVYDTASGARAYELRDHNEWILSLAFSDDGAYLASADRAGTVVVTEAQSGRNVHVIRRHSGAVHQLRFTPDSRTLLTVGADGTLRAFDSKSGRERWQRRVSGRPLTVAVSPDGKTLACGSDNRTAQLFRADGRPIATLSGARDWVYSVAFSDDGSRLFAGDWTGTTTVFDVKSRRAVQRW
ncbi:MAG: PQQ-binding-like beta-propeller repeat protein [Planctomycetes bacterium]|nr:PQQ-binding-like beta-propeller repeat protein [Planctomycetota bacterium]